MIKTNIRDSYAAYKKEAANPVSLEDYVHLTGEYHKFLLEIVLAGHKVSLPCRLGSLEIEGKKVKVKIDENGNIKGLSPDWQKTRKLWEEDAEAAAQKKLIFHTNSHSGKIRYKFLWSKKKVLVANKLLYTLVMTRTNKRTLAQHIKNGKEY
jgi:hypothetical protein